MSDLLDKIANLTYDEIGSFYKIVFEYFHAISKHGRVFNSPHEGYAVIKEEVDEAWDAIKADQVNDSCYEMAQVGAMAMRYLVDIGHGLRK